jgi:hypothetical protein
MKNKGFKCAKVSVTCVSKISEIWYEGEKSCSSRNVNERGFAQVSDEQLEKMFLENYFKPQKHSDLTGQFTIIHEAVPCVECKIHPIAGIRFKCIICENFDLCEFCEDVTSHPHALLKLKTPIQCYTNYTKLVNVFNTAEHLPGLKDMVIKKQKDPAKKKFKLKVKSYKFKKGVTLVTGSSMDFAWEIVNKGSKSWPPGAKFVLKKGDFKAQEFEIGEEIIPGAAVLVKSCVTAPCEEKEFSGVWEIDIGGKRFGKITAGFKTIFNEIAKEMAVVGFEFKKISI